MNITKLGHSCLFVEEAEARILIDPGKWSEGHAELLNVHAVLITHEHQDHYDITSLQAILVNNPSLMIYTNSGVGKKLSEAKISFQLLEHGQLVQVNGVSVEAFGADHAMIYSTIPIVRNTGYLVAERLFCTGDTVATIPSKPVEILALPVVGPWMRLEEALDYARKLKPKVCFPVHDGMLKYTDWLFQHPKNILPQFGIDVVILEQGKSQEF